MFHAQLFSVLDKAIVHAVVRPIARTSSVADSSESRPCVVVRILQARGRIRALSRPPPVCLGPESDDSHAAFVSWAMHAVQSFGSEQTEPGSRMARPTITSALRTFPLAGTAQSVRRKCRFEQNVMPF